MSVRVRAFSSIYLRLLRLRYGKPALEFGAGARFHPSARVRLHSGERGALSIGARTAILGELLTFGHGGSIRIGEDCYIGQGCRIWSAEQIVIGDRVLISHGVNIFDSLTHPISAQARHEQFRQIMSGGHPGKIDLSERPVLISDDAWIGAGAFIMSGTTLGRGAIVGAGAVVTKDVPEWTLVAGNPAQVIKQITER
jgi:acetyltransferase-like isoleucine patch superfamily enzyme